jgi:hypothetical protein
VHRCKSPEGPPRIAHGKTISTGNQSQTLPVQPLAHAFGSERLTGALLDRLTHNVYILEMNGDSFRLSSSRKRQKDKEGSKMT